ncbi:MAG: hypothetical protein QOH05_1793 [Acetobacteraceae bacterium]|jgi:hypothetical protein|nr:hypothetical protein [Acetobacteraceae bacterium]
MRPSVNAILLAASLVTALLPTAVLAQSTPAPSAGRQPPAMSSEPVLRIDPSTLPPLPPVIPASERNQMVLLSTGAGAAIGVIVVDLVTGGLLLSPLGVPGAAALLTVGGGGAAVAAPTYSIAQRVLAGIATMAAAAGGGYLGAYVARSRPDFIRLGD